MGENPRPGLRLVERAILVGVWMLSCAVVYGIGFYTGNRIQERVPAAEDRVVRLPVTAQPPQEGQRPKTGDEFTFYETLVPTGRADVIPLRPRLGPLRAAEQKTAPQAPAPKASGTPQGGDTGKVRVASRTTPGKPGKTAPAKPAATKSATTERAKSGAASPSKTASAKSPSTTRAKGPGAKTGTAPASKPRTTAARPTAAAPRSGAFTVEATSTRDRSEAEAMRANLARRGFDATVHAVPRDGGTLYRLRVGRYASAEQAEQVMRRLRDREGVSRAYVASQ